MTDAAAVVRRLWDLFEAREWDAARALLHDDFVAEWPHSRERMRGADAFIAVNRNYPEPWRIRVQRVIASGNLAVAEIAVDHPGGVSHCASFAEVEDGRIKRAREYWTDEGIEAAPAWRAEWTEPMP